MLEATLNLIYTVDPKQCFDDALVVAHQRLKAISSGSVETRLDALKQQLKMPDFFSCAQAGIGYAPFGGFVNVPLSFWVMHVLKYEVQIVVTMVALIKGKNPRRDNPDGRHVISVTESIRNGVDVNALRAQTEAMQAQLKRFLANPDAVKDAIMAGRAAKTAAIASSGAVKTAALAGSGAAQQMVKVAGGQITKEMLKWCVSLEGKGIDPVMTMMAMSTGSAQAATAATAATSAAVAVGIATKCLGAVLPGVSGVVSHVIRTNTLTNAVSVADMVIN